MVLMHGLAGCIQLGARSLRRAVFKSPIFARRYDLAPAGRIPEVVGIIQAKCAEPRTKGGFNYVADAAAFHGRIAPVATTLPFFSVRERYAPFGCQRQGSWGAALIIHGVAFVR